MEISQVSERDPIYLWRVWYIDPTARLRGVAATWYEWTPGVNMARVDNLIVHSGHRDTSCPCVAGPCGFHGIRNFKMILGGYDHEETNVVGRIAAWGRVIDDGRTYYRTRVQYAQIQKFIGGRSRLIEDLALRFGVPLDRTCPEAILLSEWMEITK